jgi:LptD protein
VKNATSYAKRYKYSGSTDLSFQQFKSGFPANTNQNKFSINWTHRKDTKSNPYWNFSSNVRFISDNNSKNNLDPLNENYFNNTFNSDINLRRLFPGKPIIAGIKIGLTQNSTNHNLTLTSPIVNVDVSRFFPLKKLTTKTNAISRLGVTYNFAGQNKSSFGDSTLNSGNFQEIGSRFQNGIMQKIKVETTAGFFKNTWKLTPSVTYENRMNFQQTEKRYSELDSLLVNDTIDTLGIAQNLNFTAQLTTAVYTYYKFIGKKEPLLRHVLTPSFGFQYIPNLNSSVTLEDTISYTHAPLIYSPFERSAYSSSQTSDRALLTFSFNNTFELKRKSDEDTITGFKKTRIIDAFSISGNYDLLKDNMNLSNIRTSLRISPVPWLNFVATSSFSPYAWADSTGATLSDYAIDTLGTLGRFISNSFTTTITFTSKKSREKLKKSVDKLDTDWNSDFEYFMLHPEYVVNFEIPWKLSFSHVYSITANQSKTDANREDWNQVQTLMMNGDLSFTKRWKLVSTINFDLEEFKVTNARFTMTRDMHCWALAFHWTPIGGNKSFLFSIRSTSSLFKDAKIDIRKPPAFL